jgi:hypothetical protein
MNPPAPEPLCILAEPETLPARGFGGGRCGAEDLRAAVGFDFEGLVGATSSSVSGSVAIDLEGEDSNSFIITSAIRKGIELAPNHERQESSIPRSSSGNPPSSNSKSSSSSTTFVFFLALKLARPFVAAIDDLAFGESLKIEGGAD